MGDPLECAIEAEDRGLEKSVLVTGLRKTGKCSVAKNYWLMLHNVP